MDIDTLLNTAIEHHASDLHLSAGLKPLFRLDGELQTMDAPILSNEMVIQLIRSVMNEEQWEHYQKTWEADFSFGKHASTRFRINAFKQDRGGAAAFRLIPAKIQTMEDLNLPQTFRAICDYPNGLILVTGPTGSGKSTTLAAMIHHINSTRYQHIVTVEDPIEFIHTPTKCLINQREVHRDTRSFSAALRSALREDPDIILVGELRDLETIRLAMTAAETGHLVFGTLHTNSSTKTIDRIIDVFPGEEKSMIRSMLSESLRAVIAQQLVKKRGGGRVAAFEIMICTTAIRNLIREDKIPQMYSTLQTGLIQGMQTLDQHLTLLVKEKIIEPSAAKILAVDKTIF